MLQSRLTVRSETSKDHGDFFKVEAAEEVEFDDAGLARV